MLVNAAAVARLSWPARRRLGEPVLQIGDHLRQQAVVLVPDRLRAGPLSMTVVMPSSTALAIVSNFLRAIDRGFPTSNVMAVRVLL
ncbi:hypothetical protein [Nonomuraea sp. NPDC049400]|uniref:hypothetical protein n=1 Tax=Nonomuraea sp. NPDC049400 TaxID=3364352 RepID=UPI00379FE961